MLEDSDRLLGMVEQVLKAGEARHAHRRRNWQEVDFAEVARNTLELARLRHNLKPEVLRFSTEPPKDLVVMGNPEELHTAVFNLLDNAIKYSGDNKDIVVDIRTPDIDSILFSVRDQGIGIPHVELKRIFNRFYRIQSSATGKVKGTGLGLFIVRSVVRRYGGDAYAESQGEGLGSTFTIRLPRVYRA
jgi:two-component system, OmpR family, sensor histidine kinase SenX3